MDKMNGFFKGIGKSKSKNKKRKTREEDDGGGGTVAGDGPTKKSSSSNKENAKKKEEKCSGGASKEQQKKGAKGGGGETVADAAATPAAPPEPGKEGGRPLVRKKDSKDTPSRMVKEDATCMKAPDTEPNKESKDSKDKTDDDILDPEKFLRDVKGRDPETMNEKQMANLRGFCKQFETAGVKGLMDEFESIKGYNIVPFEIKAHDANPTKNRYKDIFCIDASRIELKDGKVAERGDYVHANRVGGAPFINNFVTTQGPIEATVPDFWRLVVQENVGYIFMLCSIMELGKKKCEMYYPENVKDTATYCGDITVTVVERHEDAHFINTKLVLEVTGKQKRYIYHHYWKNWPDRGVPLTALAGLRLLRHARLTTFSSIVHCSAGVGRTGTLVALEWLLQKICTSPPPYDMKEMLKVMRNQRAHAIQTAPQYAYIAFAVYRLLTIKDPSTTPQFMLISKDMQLHTGVKIDGGQPPAPAAAPAAGP